MKTRFTSFLLASLLTFSSAVQVSPVHADVKNNTAAKVRNTVVDPKESATPEGTDAASLADPSSAPVASASATPEASASADPSSSPAASASVTPEASASADPEASPALSAAPFIH